MRTRVRRPDEVLCAVQACDRVDEFHVSAEFDKQTSTGRHWKVRSSVSTDSLENGFCWELSSMMAAPYTVIP